MDAYIHRQLNVPDWNQDSITNAVILVLGVGGVGCNLAACCIRLGPKKMYLVDFDVVDDHNLNRQTLYSRSDVGRRKVDAAAHTLNTLHSLGTEVVPLHFDVLKEWSRVVALIQESTVVFNAIDVGTYFDVAVGSMCRRQRIPYGAASTYSVCVIIDFFTNDAEDRPCVNCAQPGADKAVTAQLHESVIATHKDLSVVIQPDPKPTTGSVGSYAVVAGVGSQLLVQQWLKFLQGYPVPTWSSLNMVEWTATVQHSVDRDPECLCCKKL